MEELLEVGIAIGVIVVAIGIGTGIGAIINGVINHKVKKNHTNYPELVRLYSEASKLAEEYYFWWNAQHDAKMKVDDIEATMKYCGANKDLELMLSKAQEQYRNATARMNELGPQKNKAYEKANQYKEKYNIRHW